MSTRHIIISLFLVFGISAMGMRDEWSGGMREFDIDISYYGNPDGDNDGHNQNMEQLSTQDKIELIIQSFADGVAESTEGQHRLRDVRIHKNGKKWDTCDIQWHRKGTCRTGR